MGGVKIVLKHIKDDENLVFQMPIEPYKTRLNQLLEKCEAKTNGYVTITIDRPYKSRTTGEGSQNNLFWKLATLIANEIGDDTKSVEADLKMKAISRGYPYDVSQITAQPKPYSMTRVNTLEMSYLIDTAYETCAFLGIVLDPNLKKENNKEYLTSADVQEEKDSFECEGKTFIQNDLF